MKKQIEAALKRVPLLDHQSLLTLQENARRFGDAAQPVLDAIEARLDEFNQAGGMAVHRLEFAREMLRLVEREASFQWVASRDLFNRAKVEFSDNPFVIWMAGNSARQIPVTKALDDVLPEFPHLERMKDVQSLRVYFRRRG